MTVDEIRAYAHAQAVKALAEHGRAPEDVVAVVNRGLRELAETAKDETS